MGNKVMDESKAICPNCGENPDDIFYECYICGNVLCENCANICKKCGEAFCDSCFVDHKKECKKK